MKATLLLRLVPTQFANDINPTVWIPEAEPSKRIYSIAGGGKGGGVIAGVFSDE